MISVSVFPVPPESSLSYMHMVDHGAVSFPCSCVGSSNCLDANRWHSCISVVHPFSCLLLIVVRNVVFVFPLIFR